MQYLSKSLMAAYSKDKDGYVSTLRVRREKSGVSTVMSRTDGNAAADDFVRTNDGKILEREKDEVNGEEDKAKENYSSLPSFFFLPWPCGSWFFQLSAPSLLSSTGNENESGRFDCEVEELRENSAARLSRFRN